jgi:hypothetical protein
MNQELYLRALKDFKKICPEHERGYETFQKMCSFALMAPISSYHIDYSLKNQTLYFRIKYRTGAVLTLSKPLDAESEDFLAYSFVYKDDEDQTARKVGLDETENVKRQVFSLLINVCF